MPELTLHTVSESLTEMNMEEVWRKHSDTDMIKFWILSHPSNFASVILAGVVFIALVLPKIVSQYAKFFKRDYRPLMIIYNGFFFGAFGAGLPMLYITTRRGVEFFSCDAISDRRTDLRTVALKLLAVVFLNLMYLDLGIFVIRVIRGKKVSVMELMHQMLWMLIMYTTVTLHPVGSTIFAAFLHMITRIYTYGYLVLTVASIIPRSWRVSIQVLEITCNALTVVHHVYYLSQNCGNPFTLTVTIVYCGFRACLLTLKFMTMCKPIVKRVVD